MAEQEQWNNGVPPNYVEKRMAARRAEKQRRARLAKEMAERTAAAAQKEQDELVGFGEPLAEESLPQRDPTPGATASLAPAPRPPVYVPPSRSIPQHHTGVAGVALRKSKRKSRKSKSKAKSRKSRR